MAHKIRPSERPCILGQHGGIRKALSMVLTSTSRIENPMPAEMVPFGPGGGGYNRAVITYEYAHHFCPSCNLVYYFPQLNPEEEKIVKKLNR